MITKYKKFENMERVVLYSCVLLDNESSYYLKSIIPDDCKNYDVFCHHMTINLGPIKDNLKHKIGDKITMMITHIGKNESVCAVKVIPFDKELKKHYKKIDRPKFPHITMAVNTEIGGKPYMSNNIEDWDEYDGIELTGTIKEIVK